MKLNGLEKYFETNKNGEIVNFIQVNRDGWSPLFFAFYYNKNKNLNLNNKQFNYIIRNNDLTEIIWDNWSPLKFALVYNKSNNLNLNTENWKYLINNSNLSLIKDNEQLLELKKIQSEFLNDEILSKIDIKEDIIKKVKI